MAKTLNEFAANPRWLGGQPAFTLVLHTWGQELQRHVHVHAVIAFGGLAADHDAGKGESQCHYGLLAPSKGQSLAQARQQMQTPQSDPVALESAQDFLRRVAQVNLHQCPCCKLGRLRLVETLKGCKTLPVPGATPQVAPPSRGPP